jgi:plastocyanin
MVSTRAVSLFSLIVVLASCGSSGGGAPSGPAGPGPGPGPGPAPGAGVTVTVTNNAFSPNQVTVSPGGSVTWRWDSCTGGDPYGGGQQTCTAHSVTFDDGGPSAALQSEGSFSRTFSVVGTYRYHCSAHAGMAGSVVTQ